MTVDAGPVGDRLRGVVSPENPAWPLVQQLNGPMSDEEYVGLATAITRVLAETKGGSP